MSIMDFSKNGFDFDEEIDFEDYINIVDENYESLNQFLKRKNLTFQYAAETTKQLRKDFLLRCKNYNIEWHNKKSVIDYFKNNDLTDKNLYFFALVVCDNGFLMEKDRTCRTEEQNIRNAIELEENVGEFYRYIEMCCRNKIKLNKNIEKMPNTIPVSAKADEKEAADITDIFIKSIYLDDGYNEEVLISNFMDIIGIAENNMFLRAIKPLFIFLAVRNHKSRISENESFNFQLKKLFKRKIYKIDKDNGRNFESHGQMIIFFERLCNYYSHEEYIDMDLCSYGFGVTSNLSRWYYDNFLVEESYILPASKNIIEKSEMKITENMAEKECWDEFETPYFQRIKSSVDEFLKNKKDFVYDNLGADNRKFSEKIYEDYIEPLGICAMADKETAVMLITDRLYDFSKEYTVEILEKACRKYIDI